MRSYALTAALAATLLSTSLGIAYANTSELTSPNTRPGAVEKGQAIGDDQAHGITDAAPPVELFPQGSVGTTFAPKSMADHRIMQQRPRLSRIVSELGAANRRIAADHRRGYLTAMETRKVRAEERAIRTAAVVAARRDGGRLPEARFASLQERITDLNQMIHRYANNSARA